MGAGDIAEAGTSTQANAKATGDLIRAANPSAVFALGDNAYPDGSASDYATKYGMANACRLVLNCNEFMFVN